MTKEFLVRLWGSREKKEAKGLKQASFISSCCIMMHTTLPESVLYTLYNYQPNSVMLHTSIATVPPIFISMTFDVYRSIINVVAASVIF